MSKTTEAQTTIKAYSNGVVVDTIVKPGAFLAETLVTDTRVYEAVKVTAKSLTLRGTQRGDVLRREDDGSGYPMVWHEAKSYPELDTFVVRVRKDGTVRRGEGARPMRPAQLIDGKPVEYTDYRF